MIRRLPWSLFAARRAALVLCGAPALLLTLAATPAQEPPVQQQPSAPQPSQQQPAQQPSQTATQAQTNDAKPTSNSAQAPSPSQAAAAPQAGNITEEELKKMLVGKPLYLRGGYLDNSLTFDEHGMLIGHSPQGSYTLSGVEIERVRLTKHKVELEGARYGLHFLGALPYEDPTKAVDRVKITPKKKVLKITIDRELVVTPKKKREKEAKAGIEVGAQKGPLPESSIENNQPEASDVDDAKAEMAKAPEAERPADPKSITTTLSPAHAAQVMQDALGKVFAQGFDEKMMASMPGFWKLYYEAAAAKTDYRPKDAGVLRQNTVDKKAKLLTTFEPESNEFAQANGVAGMALYHTVIGADGKPGEIAVGRPIGFGLDESAVDAIRKASFEPATKDGKPVAVMLDLVVQFRIYSKRTAASSEGDKTEADKAAASAPKQLPGPYSIQHP